MHRMRTSLITAMAVLLTAETALAQQAPVKGSLLFAGGALRHDNRAVWDRFIELAGGKGALVVVVPAAAYDPTRSGQAAVDNFNRYGAKAEMVPLAPMLQDVDFQAAAKDPVLVQK